MYTDLNGESRLKLNLHTHTDVSDGHAAPEEAARIYRDAGYDAIAITDHWKYRPSMTLSGLPILPGCEYDIGVNPMEEGVFHIVALCCAREPQITRGMSPRQMIDAIHAADGFAVLAHPEWSLNTVAQVMAQDGAAGADASEIYNTVSDYGMSYRADSSAILDRLAMAGRAFPLVAADDVHYYTGDQCRSFVMVKAEAPTRDAVLAALRNGAFYASQGPEVHAIVEGDTVRVKCSPVSRINFHTSNCWRAGAVVRGEGLTEATFSLAPRPTFLRVSVVDAEGKQAWTSFVDLSQG